jgi:hypothetical protein
MRVKSCSLIVAAALITLSAGSAQAGLVVFDDFDANRQFPINGNAGDGSITVTDSPDADVDNELRKVTGTSANFLQFARTSGFGRTGPVIDALLAGDQLQVRVLSFDADVTQNFNVRLVANSNANAFGYSGLSAVSVNDGGDQDQLLTFNYAGDNAFRQALQSYAANNGTFFEFFFDNGGFPGVSAAQTFYFDDFAVNVPDALVPEPAALGLLGLASLATLRRRRA